MKLPATTYTAWIKAPEGDVVNVADDATTFEAVLDKAVSTAWGDVPFRMFRMDFDVETGAFETACEITDLAYGVLRQRLEDRGFDCPEWMEAA